MEIALRLRGYERSSIEERPRDGILNAGRQDERRPEGCRDVNVQQSADETVAHLSIEAGVCAERVGFALEPSPRAGAVERHVVVGPNDLRARESRATECADVFRDA